MGKCGSLKGSSVGRGLPPSQAAYGVFFSWFVFAAPRASGMGPCELVYGPTYVERLDLKAESWKCRKSGDEGEELAQCKEAGAELGGKKEISNSEEFRCPARKESLLTQFSVFPAFHFTLNFTCWDFFSPFLINPISQSPSLEATPALTWQLLLAFPARTAENPIWF